MTADILIQLLTNRLSYLQTMKGQYFKTGDVQNYTTVDADISNTQLTIDTLKCGLNNIDNPIE
jgi:hypothetical protein